MFSFQFGYLKNVVKIKEKPDFSYYRNRKSAEAKDYNGKKAYAQEFKEHFCICYKHYLDHYPEKISLFSIGMTMNFL